MAIKARNLVVGSLQPKVEQPSEVKSFEDVVREVRPVIKPGRPTLFRKEDPIATSSDNINIIVQRKSQFLDDLTKE